MFVHNARGPAKRLFDLVTGKAESRGAPVFERDEVERPLIMDEATHQVAEIDGLLDVLDTTRTLIGKETLYRSVTGQARAAEEIKEKQEALKELASDKKLTSVLDKLLREAAVKEKDYYSFLFAKYTGYMGSTDPDKLEFQGYGYAEHRAGMKLLPELSEDAGLLPPVKSDYLKRLVSTLVSFGDKRECKLMEGPVYKTFGGLKTKKEKGFKPGVKFRPGLIKPILVAMFALIAAFAPMMFDPEIALHTPLWMLPFVLLGVYIPSVTSFDQETFLYPLSKLFATSEETAKVLGALGELDELLSFQQYGDSYSTKVILPEVFSATAHTLELKGARNPILGKKDPDYVPNDIKLKDERVTFITGPNSGGKTALCKTITQIQLLAQIGCYVPADEASLSIVDGIYYQTPEVNTLSADVGRFGTELKHTKAIFMKTTPNSLVVLDELAEGTTYEEKLKTSITILDGFSKLGNSTLLVTHNHELADHYRKQGIGIFRQVGIEGDVLTHRFVDGISKISHAHKVAAKIGFTEADINVFLEEKKNSGVVSPPPV
ncbi:MAG: DNA mismatch repair protein MutS [Gammaproteobacteria bacterium]|nr:MAG: DNA mismatch repair protein MutS [Gammaproteobacteria bacterium]